MPAYSLTAKRAHVYGFERKQAPTYSVIQGETDSRQGQRPAPPPPDEAKRPHQEALGWLIAANIVLRQKSWYVVLLGDIVGQK